jgi:RNA polymerase sigma-70 factor (ECF subfamily)
MDKTDLQKNVISVSKGDTLAFRRFYDQFFHHVWSYARYFAKSKVVCEEIVSDVFTNVWVNKEKLPEIENMEAYLFIVTRNKAFNSYDKEERQPKITDNLSSDLGIDKINPEEILITKELEVAIQNSIDQLPERCRIVFQMSRDGKMTHQRIAEILSISENTVHAHMVTALKKLSISLKKYIYILF